MIKSHEFNKRKTKSQINILKKVSIEIPLNKSILWLRTEKIEWEQWTWPYDLLALLPVILKKMPWWNYEIMDVMANYLVNMIMITIILMMKVIIIKNK